MTRKLEDLLESLNEEMEVGLGMEIIDDEEADFFIDYLMESSPVKSFGTKGLFYKGGKGGGFQDDYKKLVAARAKARQSFKDIKGSGLKKIEGARDLVKFRSKNAPAIIDIKFNRAEYKRDKAAAMIEKLEEKEKKASFMEQRFFETKEGREAAKKAKDANAKNRKKTRDEIYGEQDLAMKQLKDIFKSKPSLGEDEEISIDLLNLKVIYYTSLMERYEALKKALETKFTGLMKWLDDRETAYKKRNKKSYSIAKARREAENQ